MTLPLIKCDDRFETGDGFELDSRFGAPVYEDEIIAAYRVGDP